MYKECPICLNPAIYEKQELTVVECLRCGPYKIVRSALTIISRKEISDDDRMNFSSWIRSKPNVELSSDQIRNLPVFIQPTVGERGLLLLKHLAASGDRLGQEFRLEAGAAVFGVNEGIYNTSTFNKILLGEQVNISECLQWFSLTWSRTRREFTFIVSRYLDKEQRWIIKSPRGYSITPRGWAHLDSLKYTNPESSIAFVAMSFNQNLDRLFDAGIYPGALDAGYEAKRVDREKFNELIDDKIISMIRQSRFIIADYTEQRGGIYFESGYAMGYGLPVIYLCNDEVDPKELHFDINHYPIITWSWDDLAALKGKITDRILATVKMGPYSQEA